MAAREGKPSPALYNDEFRALLDLLMVSDPWPLDDRAHGVLLKLLTSESAARGYESWETAYHEHRTDEQADETRSEIAAGEGRA